MAVTRMHTDLGKPYDPNKELTNNQRKRFSDTANKAEARKEQRELYDSILHPERLRAKAMAEAKAKQQHVQSEKSKRRVKVPELTFWRVLIWSITLGAFWLWVLFMFPNS